MTDTAAPHDAPLFTIRPARPSTGKRFMRCRPCRMHWLTEDTAVLALAVQLHRCATPTLLDGTPGT